MNYTNNIPILLLKTGSSGIKSCIIKYSLRYCLSYIHLYCLSRIEFDLADTKNLRG